MEKTFKGTVHIGRYSGTSEGWLIHIEDKISGCRIVEVDMSLEDFAKALGAHGDCEFGVYPANLGKVHQHKVELIFVPDVPYSFYKESDQQLAHVGPIIKALKPYQKDGWMARLSDLMNFHLRVNLVGTRAEALRKVAGFTKGERGHFANVSFHRFVDVDE